MTLRMLSRFDGPRLSQVRTLDWKGAWEDFARKTRRDARGGRLLDRPACVSPDGQVAPGPVLPCRVFCRRRLPVQATTTTPSQWPGRCLRPRRGGGRPPHDLQESARQLGGPAGKLQL